MDEKSFLKSGAKIRNRKPEKILLPINREYCHCPYPAVFIYHAQYSKIVEEINRKRRSIPLFNSPNSH